MTDQDDLSRLARAITEAEDELNSSNHRDNVQQLAVIDSETRPHLVDRIEAREKALDVARDAMRAYANAIASGGAVKVEIAPSPPVGAGEELMDALAAARRHMEGATGINDRWPGHQVANPYSNGLDGHNEE